MQSSMTQLSRSRKNVVDIHIYTYIHTYIHEGEWQILLCCETMERSWVGLHCCQCLHEICCCVCKFFKYEYLLISSRRNVLLSHQISNVQSYRGSLRIRFCVRPQTILFFVVFSISHEEFLIKRFGTLIATKFQLGALTRGVAVILWQNIIIFKYENGKNWNYLEYL